MATLEYTEMQFKVIRGEIPIETANGHILHPLYKKAIANGDKELVEKIDVRFRALKAENAEKARRRELNRLERKKRSEFQWKQPKSNKYTEHQKQIVRGEIPYEDVHTNELISLHLKAQNNGDYELSEHVLSLITDRQKDAEFKRKTGTSLYKKCCAAKSNSPLDIIYTDPALTTYENAVLMGVVDLCECSENDLKHILYVVQKQGDENKIRMAQKLLAYKQDPTSVYVIKDHRAAIDSIEAMLQLPIKRPKNWFAE